MQPCEPQSGIAAADVAAEPHLSVGLGERAEGEGAMRPGSNHAARLEPRCRSGDESTFCPQCRLLDGSACPQIDTAAWPQMRWEVLPCHRVPRPKRSCP